MMMKSNVVSPEPYREQRLYEAKKNLIKDVISGRKSPVEAIKEYNKEKRKIEAERNLDKYRRY